jgi:5-methyltetrahydrofolate--homocysteine methyltransferase
VGVAQNLISEDMKADYVKKIREDYEQVRVNHASRRSAAKWLSLADARANKTPIDWSGYTPVKPTFTGTKIFDDYDLQELAEYIDWTPFFHAWELKGSYPKIFDDPDKGEEAKKLFADARAMMQQIIEEKWLQARAVIGFWPANQVNDDDIEVYTDDSRGEVLTVLHNLRQQQEKPAGKPNRCLSDFVAPKDAGVADYIGAFAVTAGLGIEEHVERFEKDHDDYHAIMLKALADRLAEAFAERMHERVRKEFWGYAADESLSNEQLIKESYKGIRPAAGYPACPDHTEKDILWDLLHAEKATGIWLTEAKAMVPTASVSGVYYSHPESSYFAVGKINQSQVEDYARRKGMSLAEAERWLSPNLGYEPD